MSLPVTQLVATTYDAVAKGKQNKAADNWSDSSFLKTLEEKDGIRRVSGSALKLTIDYQANSGADFLATTSTTTSTSPTTVLSEAVYDWATLIVPSNWTFTDEILNATGDQKIDMVSGIVDNAIRSHDQAIESGMFAAAATDGFESLLTLFTEDGTGTIGSIVAGTETWWKNKFKDYDAAATLVADMTTLYTSCAKGSMGSQPNVIGCGATEYGVYSGKLVANQRYTDANKANGSFKALDFINAVVVYSAGTTNDSYFFINTEFTKLYVAKNGFRKRLHAPTPHTNAAMFNMKTGSVLQLATSARSRNGVLFT